MTGRERERNFPHTGNSPKGLNVPGLHRPKLAHEILPGPPLGYSHTVLMLEYSGPFFRRSRYNVECQMCKTHVKLNETCKQ